MSGYNTSSNLPFHLAGEDLTEVIVLGVISTISTVSVCLLLLYLFISFITGQEKDTHDEQILLRTHFGAFAVFLFLSDLTQGLSGVIELAWVAQHQITPGSLCTAQAVMLQIGDVGTAVWNAVIAIHTFWAVVLGKKMTNRAAIFLALIGWATCLLLTTIGPLAIQTKENGPFYGVAGAWCFITDDYQYQRVLLHYLPMLLSAGIITILYVLVALVLFRILIVNGNSWRFEAPARKSNNIVRDFFGQFSWGRLYRTSPTGNTQSVIHGWENSAEESNGNRNNVKVVSPSSAEVYEYEDPLSTMSARLRNIAIKMLWYPSVYLVLILPMTIARIDLSVSVDLNVMLGFTCLLLFMGTANTIIFAFTRRLGPAPWARRLFQSTRTRKAERTIIARPTQSVGGVSLQIRVDRYTQRGHDDRSIDLPRKKSFASILTDITTISSIPPAAMQHGHGHGGGHGGGSGSKDDFSLDHHHGEESQMGMESSGGMTPTHARNLPSPSSPSSPHMHQFRSYIPGRQEQYSSYPFILPETPTQHTERREPQRQEWSYSHPYARPSYNV